MSYPSPASLAVLSLLTGLPPGIQALHLSDELDLLEHMASDLPHDRMKNDSMLQQDPGEMEWLRIIFSCRLLDEPYSAGLFFFSAKGTCDSWLLAMIIGFASQA